MNPKSHRFVSLFKLVVFIILISLILDTACAHPGRTDSKGGHTCRTNCEKWGLDYGEYHYHNDYYSTPSTPIPITPKPSPNATFNISKPVNQTSKFNGYNQTEANMSTKINKVGLLEEIIDFLFKWFK